MLTDFLQDQAALYATGQMPPADRAQFEVLLAFHEALRAFTSDMAEVGAELIRAALPANQAVPPELKARILGRVLGHPQQAASEGLVVSGPNRLVEWVSPAFSAMCGYDLAELRGKNLGPILQGEKTDRATAERMRRAVREFRPCRETILNYHKNGQPYWVEIDIQPYCDDTGQPLWLIARECELPDRAVA